MCDPITLGSAVLTAGSVAANAVGAAQANGARNDALSAERIRQTGYRKEADALNLQSQDRYQNFDNQRAERAGTLADAFKAAPTGTQTSAPIAPSVMPQSGSNVTVSSMDAAKKTTDAFSDQQAAALGNLRSFGDVMGSIGRSQARDAGQIGQIGGFMRGSSGVLPLELDAASQQGAGMRTLGALLGAVGKMGLNAGLTQGLPTRSLTGAAEATSGGPILAPF